MEGVRPDWTHKHRSRRQKQNRLEASTPNSEFALSMKNARADSADSWKIMVVIQKRNRMLREYMPFKSLFRSSSTPKDGFNQAEREALVDILHYCMYADKHISVAEDEAIEAVARTLDWDPKISYEYYEGKSTGVVRAALDDAGLKKAFFESVATRLRDPAHRKFALTIADDIMKADGLKKPDERKAVEELKAFLKPE